MKRKDLTAYIREQIIDELTEGAATDAAKDAGASNPSAAAKTAVDAAKKDKTGTATIVGPKGTKVIDKATPLEEDDIDEARKPGAYSKGSKFDDAKEIYSQGLIAYVLKAIEELGDEAVPAKIVAKIKEYDPKAKGDVGTILRNFRAVGIITGGPLAATPKPEKGAKEEEPEVEEPETVEPEKDEWESPEEEEPETGEEEPTAVSDKEVEKTVGKAYAELSPEEEDVFGKFKQAIINKAKILTDKKASKDDKTKAQAAIDNYKTKADLKKIFAKKGLNLIDFINGELKK